MRILLRSDAGLQTGTGHVMRCLTLAEELTVRGHEVHLHGRIGVPWLVEQVGASGVAAADAEPDALDVDSDGWDAVVVDSYTIDPRAISDLASRVPLLAIIDADDRGIDAGLYLDQNLGAEHLAHRPRVAERLIAGSKYALVRRSIAALRREDRRELPRDAPGPPRVLAFFGGTDPFGAIPRIAEGLAPLIPRVEATLIVAPQWRSATVAALAGAPARLLEPTPDLPGELARTDIVISASGTSAWDIGTIGIAAVFAAVVGNQRDGLHAILESGTALGVDASEDLTLLRQVGGLVERLVDDTHLRATLVQRSLATYDGLGASRVTDALERLAG